MRIFALVLVLLASGCAQATREIQTQPNVPVVQAPATHNPFEPREEFYEGVGSAPVTDPDIQHARDLAWMRAHRALMASIGCGVGMRVGGLSEDGYRVGDHVWVRLSMEKSNTDQHVFCR